jgi:hypothetical protein
MCMWIMLKGICVCTIRTIYVYAGLRNVASIPQHAVMIKCIFRSPWSWNFGELDFHKMPNWMQICRSSTLRIAQQMIFKCTVSAPHIGGIWEGPLPTQSLEPPLWSINFLRVLVSASDNLCAVCCVVWSRMFTYVMYLAWGIMTWPKWEFSVRGGSYVIQHLNNPAFSLIWPSSEVHAPYYVWLY